MSIIHKTKVIQDWKITINRLIKNKLGVKNGDGLEFVEYENGTIVLRKELSFPHRALIIQKKALGEEKQ